MDGRDAQKTEGAFYWYLSGLRAAFSIPGLVLFLSFVGFAALARETGFSLAETAFMIAVIWALPAKVVLVGAVTSGATLPAAAFAVALSSVRLMPMTVSLVPEMRAPSTRPWVLYLLSHFIAVTSWVIAMDRFAGIPRPRRTAFYLGIGSTLLSVNVIVASVVYLTAARMPPGVSAAFFMLTPMYFLASLWGAARERAGRAAMIVGLALGPVFHFLTPRFELLAAGVVGGLIAYGGHRLSRRRAAT